MLSEKERELMVKMNDLYLETLEYKAKSEEYWLKAGKLRKRKNGIFAGMAQLYEYLGNMYDKKFNDVYDKFKKVTKEFKEYNDDKQ